MKYGSVCSGIEAATLAWESLGWQAKFFAEVEPFPSAVLSQRFGATSPLRPLDSTETNNEKEKKQRQNWAKQIALMPKNGSIPNLGDFTKIKENDYDGDIDILVGGCPCQSYSLAGLRKGLADPRGNLSLEFVKLCYRTKARIIIFENVPGLLSSGKCGSDFANLLSLLCGWEVKPPKDGWRKSGIVTNAPACYGVAWRILDAQYTRVSKFPRAVPQRRRRLILIGYLGDWQSAAKVLFDQEMFGGNTPPCRTKRERFTTSSERGFDKTNSIRMRSGDPTRGGQGALIAEELSHTLATNNDQTIVSYSFDTRKTSTATPELVPTLVSTDYKGGKAICYGVAGATVNAEISEDIQPTLKARNQGDSYICYENHANDSRIAEVNVSPVISARAGTGGGNLPLVQETKTFGFIKNDAGGNQQGYWQDVFPTIRSQVTPAIAIAENIIGRKVENGGNGIGAKEEIAYTQNATGVMGVAYQSTVRRLLPVECERLMGMPDNHTQISWKGLPPDQCPDAPRYKAIGNSMAVNVMRWVGERIEKVEKELECRM